MKKYQSLIRNNVYLYLLAFYDGEKMPTFVELSNRIGITRQTASTRITKLKEEKIINVDDDDILSVLNVLDLDVECLKRVLIQYPHISSKGLENLFLNNIKNKNVKIILEETKDQLPQDDCIVYGIISEGIIKYVGCTKNFYERIQQHMRKRPFLTKDNFIILKKVEGNDKFFYERQLINILKPE